MHQNNLGFYSQWHCLGNKNDRRSFYLQGAYIAVGITDRKTSKYQVVH
jgi:hypothetical protein